MVDDSHDDSHFNNTDADVDVDVDVVLSSQSFSSSSSMESPSTCSGVVTTTQYRARFKEGEERISSSSSMTEGMEESDTKEVPKDITEEEQEGESERGTVLNCLEYVLKSTYV